MGARVLAMDLGSSSVRAMVFETLGAGHLGMVEGALARRPRHLNTAQPGQATFDVDSYLADLVACIDELHGKGLLDGVTAVAADSQWHSVVAVDSRGQAVTDLVSWADTRPRRRGAVPGDDELEQLRQRTGCAFAPMYWTCRLPWLSARMPGGLPAGGRFLGLAEYVGLHLLGDPSVSVSMASGTGLLGTAGHAWDTEALELAEAAPAQLPEIAPPDWRGRLAEPWRRRWPQLAGTPWHPVLGDGAAANLGVGCDGPTRAAMTVGTSAAVRTVRPGPGPQHLAPGLWRYCVDRDKVVLGAAYSSGGQLYSWALSLWEGTSTGATGTIGGAASHSGAVSHEVRYDLPMPVPAGSQGVLVLPWQAGTRPPAVPVPAGQGCVLGLGLGHGGAHIVSAAAEAVCFQLADGLAQLEASAEGQLEVLANGGAIERSPWWQQRLAGAVGRTVSFSTVPETTARGAAALALGVDLGAADLEGEPVTAAEDQVGVLAEARRRWASWYRSLLPLVGAGNAPGPGR